MSTKALRVRMAMATWCGVLAACALAAPLLAAEQPQTVEIARVDGQPVSGGDFEPYLRAYLRSKLYHSGSPERMRVLADEAIDAFLVDRVLAAQAAARGVAIDAAEVEKRLADIKARFSARPEWAEISTRLPSLRQEIETDLKMEALKREISRVQPASEADIRAFYDSQPELFTRPAGYRLKLLLIGVAPGASADTWRAAETQAHDLARKISAGEAFATLARAHSKHSSSDQGGAIGLVHEGQLGEAAEVALRAASAGGLAGPVRLLEGVALFDVEEKRPAALSPFDEVKERASSLLARDRATKQWSGYVDTLRGRFSVDRPAFAEFLGRALK